jgi:hypothetical protein
MRDLRRRRSDPEQQLRSPDHLTRDKGHPSAPKVPTRWALQPRHKCEHARDELSPLPTARPTVVVRT